MLPANTFVNLWHKYITMCANTVCEKTEENTVAVCGFTKVIYDGLPLPLCVCQTGVVQVNRRLDRERVAEYRLTITVKDNPENPRIARRVMSLFTERPLYQSYNTAN